MDQHHPRQQADVSGSDATRQQAACEAIASVRAGDVNAFARLVKEYEAQIMSLCVTLMRDVNAAEELAQDVFVRAFRYLHAFDSRRPFYPWLAKIAYRLAQTRWQERRREAALVDESLGQQASNRPDDDPLGRLVADEQARHLWRAVHALPDAQRAAVVLYYGNGMDIREVARALGVSTGTIKTLLFRARKRLDAALRRANVRRPEEGAG